MTMHVSIFSDPTVTLALALLAGVLGQALAKHINLPGIVVLLGAGVVLGPDVLNVVRPETLGLGLPQIVGFSVAVILFEGGMNLSLRRLRRERRAIRQLVTWGALVTALGATLCAHFIMDWEWKASILFGTLVIVTGPTVVNPLLKRLKVQKSVSTVLEAEGVLIDAVGAIVAVVALDIALNPIGPGAALSGVFDVVQRLAFGAGLGVCVGLAISAILRTEVIVPEGLENIFTLAMVWALYHLADGFVHESGIAAVTIAGMAVTNYRPPSQRDLHEFKEQLTTMLIGLLFVVLAADVRTANVVALGWPGVLTVLALMFVVRPLNVMVGTLGSELSWQQRLFMGWIGPRGIVSAAVASLFAAKLKNAGVPGGVELQALVFLVIAMTVLSAGLTGGLVAGLLGLRRRSNAGYVILGANELARVIGRELEAGGEEVLLVDSNSEICSQAESDGFRVLYGNALQDRTLGRLEIDTRLGAIGLTPNEEVNLLFIQKIKREAKLRNLYVTLDTAGNSVTPNIVKRAGAEVHLGASLDVELWAVRIRRKVCEVERWRFVEAPEGNKPWFESLQKKGAEGMVFLVVAHWQKSKVLLATENNKVKVGDELSVLVFSEKADLAYERLRSLGCERVVDEGERDAEVLKDGTLVDAAV